MILTCPSCSAKYMIPDGALGDAGRDVRCAKCGHTWFEKSEKDTLNELIERIQSQEMDEIFWATQQKPEKKQSVKRKYIHNAIQKVKAFLPRNIALDRHIRTSRTFAGIMVGVAVFTTGLFLVVQGRVGGAAALPFTAKVFDATGFYVPKPPGDNAEKMLAFDHLVLDTSGKGKTPTIKGMLVNLTAGPVAVPMLRIAFTSMNGKELGHKDLSLAAHSIEKEGTISLDIPLPDGLPEHAGNLDIYFTDGNKKN